LNVELYIKSSFKIVDPRTQHSQSVKHIAFPFLGSPSIIERKPKVSPGFFIDKDSSYPFRSVFVIMIVPDFKIYKVGSSN
jgi:hypothetical protein